MAQRRLFAAAAGHTAAEVHQSGGQIGQSCACMPACCCTVVQKQSVQRNALLLVWRELPVHEQACDGKQALAVPMQVWTPLQYARALVQSFPWMPDPLSIANCVAEQAKEPSAEELLSGRTSSLASTSTTSIPSHLSNGSHTGQPGRPGHSASQPMLHDMSARMSWLQSGQAGGQPSAQLGQAFRQAKLLQLGRQSPPKPAPPVCGLPMAAPTTSQSAPCPASSAPQM